MASADSRFLRLGSDFRSYSSVILFLRVLRVQGVMSEVRVSPILSYILYFVYSLKSIAIICFITWDASPYGILVI